MNNVTSAIPPNITEIIRKLTQENKNNNEAGDATWILTSAFIIFTMQSGFGLLEAGTWFVFRVNVCITCEMIQVEIT